MWGVGFSLLVLVVFYGPVGILGVLFCLPCELSAVWTFFSGVVIVDGKMVVKK